MNIIKSKELYDIPNGWTIKTAMYGGSNSRIKATCQRDRDIKWSKIVAYDYSLSTLGCHVKAVHALVNSDQWFYQDSEHNPEWEIVSWGSDWAGYTFIVHMTRLNHYL